MTETLSSFLRAVSTELKLPVLIVLIALMAAVVVLFGTVIAEYVTERRKMKVDLPKLVDLLRKDGCDIEACVNGSGLLKRQKEALVELLHHPELNDTMREALALELLEKEKFRYAKIVKVSDMIAKLGPIFGLLGTIIPLGPGIVALGGGDTLTLSQSLLTAFDTTVAGLISAAIAMVFSTIRKNWYSEYMSILEALMTCELEVIKDA